MSGCVPSSLTDIHGLFSALSGFVFGTLGMAWTLPSWHYNAVTGSGTSVSPVHCTFPER